MEIIGAANEVQAEWLVNRFIEHFDKLMKPPDAVICIEPGSEPAQILEQVQDMTTELMQDAIRAATDIMLASLTLGVKVGQAR